MATSLKVRIHLSTAPASSIEFDADGPWTFVDQERVYREASNPPELESIRRQWEVTGKVITPDNTAEAGWDRFHAFVNALDTRGVGSPTKLELVRVETPPTGPPVETVEATLGPPTWQGFKVDNIQALPTDPENPAGTYLTTFPLRILFSAGRLLPVGGGGQDAALVGFEQTLEVSDDEAGLSTVTQVTAFTVGEGQSAEALAELYGKLDVSEWGSNYSYKTNGDAGYSIEHLDPDSRVGRAATKVRVTSQIRGWGAPTGVTDPGSSPGEFSKLVRTETHDDETVQVVRAAARGPGAEAWVRQQKPAGDLDRDVEEHDTFRREFVGEWTIKGPAPGTELITTVAMKLSGGYAAVDYEEVTGDQPPVRMDGAVQKWALTVAIRVERRGGTGALADLPLPKLLPAPWTLDADASFEGVPTQDPGEQAKKKTSTAAKWVREVSLVYGANEAPSEHPYEVMRQAASDTVASYWI